MTRELICTAVEIAIAQNDAASDDGIIRREADAGFLEKMIEPLARSPADCIARMLLAYDTLRAARRLTPFRSGCRCASGRNSTTDSPPTWSAFDRRGTDCGMA